MPARGRRPRWWPPPSPRHPGSRGGGGNGTGGGGGTARGSQAVGRTTAAEQAAAGWSGEARAVVGWSAAASAAGCTASVGSDPAGAGPGAHGRRPWACHGGRRTGSRSRQRRECRHPGRRDHGGAGAAVAHPGGVAGGDGAPVGRSGRRVGGRHGRGPRRQSPGDPRNGGPGARGAQSDRNPSQVGDPVLRDTSAPGGRRVRVHSCASGYRGKLRPEGWVWRGRPIIVARPLQTQPAQIPADGGITDERDGVDEEMGDDQRPHPPGPPPEQSVHHTHDDIAETGGYPLVEMVAAA